MSFILLGILNAQAEAGVAGAYDLLETTVLTGSQSSVSFTSLNSTYGSTYKHLQIRMVGRVDKSATSDDAGLEINNDSTSSYSQHGLYGQGSSVVSSGGANTSKIQINRYTAASSAANSFGVTVLDILDPFSTSKHTTVRYLGGMADSANFIFLGSGAYNKTDAVNQLSLIGDGVNWVSGSRFSLYGIRAA